MTLNLVDTNILLRWVRPDEGGDYDAGEKGIDHLLQQGVKLCYTSQNLAEFWNVCTRPASGNRGGYGLNIHETNFRAKVIEENIRPSTGPPGGTRGMAENRR